MLIDRRIADGIADGSVTLVLPWFKRRVRQLKGLGLTICLDVGYRLSPHGRAYLRATSN